MSNQTLKTFFEVFDTPNGPVLGYKWHDDRDKENPYQIVLLAVDAEGTQISSTTRVRTEALQLQLWAEVDKDALKVVKGMIRISARLAREAFLSDARAAALAYVAANFDDYDLEIQPGLSEAVIEDFGEGANLVYNDPDLITSDSAIAQYASDYAQQSLGHAFDRPDHQAHRESLIAVYTAGVNWALDYLSKEARS